GPNLFQQGLTPFMSLAFRHAHAAFADRGMDSQLYAEDPLTPSRMPSGLVHELSGDKLAGLLTIDATFPTRHMTSEAWRSHAVPHVHVGAIAAPHRFYVDRRAFLERAVALAAEQGRRTVALVEKHEHLVEDLPYFRDCCADAGLAVAPVPDAMPSASLSFEAYGYELLHRVWSQQPRPDVLVIPDDAIAKGVAQAALALGLAVPDQCTLIAMVNRGSRLFYPVPLTALEVDVARMVEGA